MLEDPASSCAGVNSGSAEEVRESSSRREEGASKRTTKGPARKRG